MNSNLKLLIPGLVLAGSAVSMLPSAVDAAGNRRVSGEPNYYCYVEAQNGAILSLESMCGQGSDTSDAGGSSTSSSGSSTSSRSSSSGSSSGNCDTPDDIAADGSRCGERAASARAGGR